MKQLLNKNRSKYASNKTTSVNVDIKSSQRLLPFGNVGHTVNAYQVYLDEKNDCTTFRLNFNIKPYCSNVLHNMFTEVVQNEDDNQNRVVLNNIGITVDGAINTTPVTRKQAIKDTEYSHPLLGQFVYHCGIDIFDNHNFRHKEYFALAKPDDDRSDFNTLSDKQRDCDGNKVSTAPKFENEDRIQHSFNLNNCSHFLEAYSQNIFEKDGWYGFYNPSTLPFAVGGQGTTEIFLNKAMNNNKPCEFYELYPDRSLYSFIPKINKSKQTEEYNWDYCLTYPFAEEKTPNGCDWVYDSGNKLNGIKIIGHEIDGDIVYLRTIVKHNLNDTSRINIKNVYWGEHPVEMGTSVRNIGDINKENKDFWFSISVADIMEIFITNANGELVWPNEMRIAKTVEDRECDYYFQKLRKIPSKKFYPVIPDKTEILEDDSINEALAAGTIASVLGKAGFARTIYDEQIAQIIFNEDIDVAHLRDNKGRKLSEIYLTILKRARGGYEWYEGDVHSDNIEFSHCFGKLTAGLDIPLTEEEYEAYNKYVKDYNVHCIHNVKHTTGKFPWYSAPESGKLLNSSDKGIVIEDNEFIGNLVEWDYANCEETVLSDICYRFNTYQREYTGDTFGRFAYHDIVSDDNTVTQDGGIGDFIIEEKYFGDANKLGNVFHEGYYYHPHNKIVLHEWSNNTNKYYDTKVVYYDYKLEEVSGKTLCTIYTSIPQVVYPGETIILRYNDIAYECEVKEMLDSNTIVIYLNDELDDIIEEIDMKLDKYMSAYTGNDDIEDYDGLVQNPFVNRTIQCYIKTVKPEGAQYQPGTGNEYRNKEFQRYEYSSQELMDATFTNNAIYLETNIDFYLRRQDPFGIYKLNAIQSEDGALTMFNIVGKQLTFKETIIPEEESTLCD